MTHTCLSILMRTGKVAADAMHVPQPTALLGYDRMVIKVAAEIVIRCELVVVVVVVVVVPVVVGLIIVVRQLLKATTGRLNDFAARMMFFNTLDVVD